MRKRKDSFFGLHFDFHATRNSVGLGDCDVELIDKMLSEVKPDFVQCDTKGHPGISSYPTKVGNPAPEMKGDLLRTWRELTKKHDVEIELDVAEKPTEVKLEPEGKILPFTWDNGVVKTCVDKIEIHSVVVIK